MNKSWNVRCFGAHDKPPCASCGNQTFLTRRSPAAAYALQLERQIFTCLECNLDFERIVDADGRCPSLTLAHRLGAASVPECCPRQVPTSPALASALRAQSSPTPALEFDQRQGTTRVRPLNGRRAHDGR